jgi:hypothetical protein
MSVIDRLKRLSGEKSPQPQYDPRQAQIGQLRKRVEQIMARRPDTAIRTPSPLSGPGKRAALSDLIPGEERHNAHGRFFLVPGQCKGSSYHGARCIRDYTDIDMRIAALIANDPALADFHFTDGLFLDTETTGLMGGTGTLAFLIGLGWFEGDTFVTRQIFARDFSEESASLTFLQDVVRDKKFLVTFNGKAFDVGLLTTRFILNRLSNPLSELPHLDLLHPSRRLFGHRLINSRLISLEEGIIGFYREGDLPGSEIPQRYFDWLKRRDARFMVDVVEHNRLDILSMAALTGHLTGLLANEMDMDRCDHRDLLCASRLLQDRGHRPEAQIRLTALAHSDNHAVKAESLKMLSLIHKRACRWDEAVGLWEEMIDHDPDNVFALIELAKWFEHRRRNYRQAQTLVEKAIALAATEKERTSLTHRLNRLYRYLDDNP